jgi:predicted nucleic acid-binding protein
MKHGIPVMDALHIAAASLAKCEALVTAEKASKPIFRTRLVPVFSIADRDWR